MFGTVAGWFLDLIVEVLCLLGLRQLPHVRFVLLAHLSTDSTTRVVTQPAVVENGIKALDGCIPGNLNGIRRLRGDYAQRYRVEVGAHPVAANADQTEILHAKVERTIHWHPDEFVSAIRSLSCARS